MVRIIRTSAGGPYERLRVVVNLRRDQLARLGWEEGTLLEIADHPDGLLLRPRSGKRAARE